MKKPRAVKTIPAQQMLPTQFEPKRRHRFIVEFDGLDSFLVKRFDYPSLKPKGGDLVPIGCARIHMHCSVKPSTEQQVAEVVAKQAEVALDDCVIKYLDPVGTVVSEHVFVEPVVVRVEYTSPSYDENGLMECIVSFEYGRLDILY